MIRNYDFYINLGFWGSFCEGGFVGASAVYGLYVSASKAYGPMSVQCREMLCWVRQIVCDHY